MFKKGNINSVLIFELKKYIDERGWLSETFRQDDLIKMINTNAENFFPVMSYVSITYPNIARGPHEHEFQSDLFAFLGPSNFKIYLWDNRKSSSTYLNKIIFYAGIDSPKSVLIPPGVVHAYKNVGRENGMVLNFPNKLFAGVNKKEEVDEIRHEDDSNTIFKLE